MVEGYAGVVVEDVGNDHLELVEMRRVCDGEYGDKRADFGTEEATFVVQRNRDVTLQSRLHRHHRRPSFPCR